MNRKMIIICTLLFVKCAVSAQIAYWIIQPKYDSIKDGGEAGIIISTTSDSTYLWRMDGKFLSGRVVQ